MQDSSSTDGLADWERELLAWDGTSPARTVRDRLRSVAYRVAYPARRVRAAVYFRRHGGPGYCPQCTGPACGCVYVGPEGSDGQVWDTRTHAWFVFLP